MTDQPRPDGEQADPASAPDTLEELAAYLAAAFDSGDAAHLLDALAVAARADATTHLAAAAGIPQAALRHGRAEHEHDARRDEGHRPAHAGSGALTFS